jgi:uncharacterized cofD-like protein
MAKKRRSGFIVAAWMISLVICEALIISGFLIDAGLWNGTGGNFWGRLFSGLLLVLAGMGIGYMGTLQFLRGVSGDLARNEGKTGIGRAKGPKIVVIGGGTGLGTILRGLKEISGNISAIVTVADDGGSSGRLRRDFGILPPGDIRNCLVALADLEPTMERLMQYRFHGPSDLEGHSFGNLFLTVMTDITGDFEKAIKESSKVLAVRGQVLPATLENITLKAELIDGTVISGESKIPKAQTGIKRVYLEPEICKPVPGAVTAIKEADIIILGPGSLYTSVIPNLLVGEIADAIRQSTAMTVYICNAMTQPGETDGYSASDHVKAIMNHAGAGLIDMVVVNTEPIPDKTLERYAEEGGYPVTADLDKLRALGVTPLTAEIIINANVIRHDPRKLAMIIDDLARSHEIGAPFGKQVTKQLYRLLKGFSSAFSVH